VKPALKPTLFLAGAAALLIGSLVATTTAEQRMDAFVESREHPSIAYNTAPVHNAVSELNRRLDEGSATLAFDPSSGFLRSVLDALSVPIESQVLVYTQTSLQAQKINMQNPRAIYFSDNVSVGWVRGGLVLEVWAQDPRQGTIFYTLDQQQSTTPRLGRQLSCLSCHLTWDTLGVPGPSVLTTFPRKDNRDYANGHVVDHRSDIAERWGGWYVTGKLVPSRHMGNLPLFMSPPFPAKSEHRLSMEGAFDLTGYPTPYSDIVSLLVLEHQSHLINLITRAGWESRVGGNPARVREAVNTLVDYMLFVDESPLPGPVEGTSNFAQTFSAKGPRDAKGRSLRDFQLTTRMMQYPLSYMIYSEAFDALPADARNLAYQRFRDVLSGGDTREQYAHLTPDLRRAIVEILEATKPDYVASMNVASMHAAQPR
jgi:hypothetical protein